jgi:DNA-binding beta-propeller fold protein YncE
MGALQISREGTLKRLAIGLLIAAAAVIAGPSGYKEARTFTIGGNGFWDYVTVDSTGRRIFVSHATEVDVVSLDTGKVIGKIPGTPGVHGIALAPEAGKGFITAGQTNEVVVFDLKTLKTVGRLTAGKGPDATIYDESTGSVLVFNGGGDSATVIDARRAAVTGTVALGGGPEFAAADGKGKVFVNLEDKSQVVEFDPKALKVDHTWPLAPCQSPSAMSMDRESRRLFIGCRNQMMAVVNADTGNVVTTLPIGRGVDAGRFDPVTKFAFASCGDGTTTVVHEDGSDHYSVVDTLHTRVSARTMGLDLKTHAIYLPFAETKPNPNGRRPLIVPGSFAVLEMTRQ